MDRRTFEVVTTYNQNYYDRWGKKMIQTFLEYWPKDVTLWCYWEEQKPEIFADNLKYLNLLEVQPQLKAWIDKWKHDKKKNGWDPNGMNKTTGEFGIWDERHNGIKYSHKVFAQTHRIKNSTADVIFYSDADTLTFAKPDLKYMYSIMPKTHLACTFERDKRKDETGFYMHNPKHPRAKDWANELEKMYLNDEIWDFELGQADQYTMWYGKQRFPHCKFMNLMEHHNLSQKNHPFVNSPMGSFMDSLKGGRKEKGTSSWQDIDNPDRRRQAYWRKVKAKEIDKK